MKWEGSLDVKGNNMQIISVNYGANMQKTGNRDDQNNVFTRHPLGHEAAWKPEGAFVKGFMKQWKEGGCN
jgi:hypothetical protein